MEPVVKLLGFLREQRSNPMGYGTSDTKVPRMLKLLFTTVKHYQSLINLYKIGH